jgi:hypothetical protein
MWWAAHLTWRHPLDCSLQWRARGGGTESQRRPPTVLELVGPELPLPPGLVQRHEVVLRREHVSR